MPRWFGSVLVVSAALAMAAGAMATNARTPSRFTAQLNNREEVPKPKNAPRLADGKFTATLDGKTLKWELTFDHLSGKATAAHIHLGVKGKAGPVIIPLCGPCKSPAKGVVKVTSAQIEQLADRKTYVNVHTAKNPAGEIRGQIH